MKPPDVLGYLLKSITEDISKTSGSYDRNIAWVKGMRGSIIVTFEGKIPWILVKVPSESRGVLPGSSYAMVYAPFLGHSDDELEQLMDSAIVLLECRDPIRKAMLLVLRKPQVWRVHADSDPNSKLQGFREGL